MSADFGLFQQIRQELLGILVVLLATCPTEQVNSQYRWTIEDSPRVRDRGGEMILGVLDLYLHSGACTNMHLWFDQFPNQDHQ